VIQKQSADVHLLWLFLFLTQSTSQRRKTPQPVRKKTLKTQTLKEFIFIDFLVCILRHWSDKSCKNNLRLNKCVCRALKLFQRRPGRCEVVIQKLSKFVEPEGVPLSTTVVHHNIGISPHGDITISRYRNVPIFQSQCDIWTISRHSYKLRIQVFIQSFIQRHQEPRTVLELTNWMYIWHFLTVFTVLRLNVCTHYTVL